LTAFVLGGCAAGDRAKVYPSTQLYQFYPIYVLNEAQIPAGQYNTEGFVVEISSCVPCPPPPAECKPCPKEDSILVGENRAKKIGTELTVFSKNAGQFELGKKYRFSLKMGDRQSGKPGRTDLVGYNLLQFRE
jgi:hypothetical protein